MINNNLPPALRFAAPQPGAARTSDVTSTHPVFGNCFEANSIQSSQDLPCNGAATGLDVRA